MEWKTNKDFADEYHQMWKSTDEELENTPWYLFKKRSRLNKRSKWAEYHYTESMKLAQQDAFKNKTNL